MSEVDKDFKDQAVKWLTEKPRSNEEIAEKMLQAVNETYYLSRERFKKYSTSSEILLREIFRPVRSGYE